MLVSDDSDDEADDASKGKRKAAAEDSGDEVVASTGKRPKVQPGAPPPPVFPDPPEDPPQVSSPLNSRETFYSLRHFFRKPFLTRVSVGCFRPTSKTFRSRWRSSRKSLSRSVGCSTSAPSPLTLGGGTPPTLRPPLLSATRGSPRRRANQPPTFSPTRTPNRFKVLPAFLT